MFENDSEVDLAKTEFVLLYRANIIDAFYGYGLGYAENERMVDIHIKTLRQKLKTGKGVVKTIRG